MGLKGCYRAVWTFMASCLNVNMFRWNKGLGSFQVFPRSLGFRVLQGCMEL